VRESSRLLRPFNPALAVHPFAVNQVADAGDLAVNPFSIDAAVADIEAGARGLLERAGRLVTIGGDHTIALPLLRAMHAEHGPVAVVHFDAHLDTWDTYFGAPVTHGTPFRRASEEGLLDPSGCLHVGVRGPLYGATDLVDDAALGFQIVAVDIDVRDPAFAPGTGTPESGALLSRELLAILRSFATLDLIGADVVEVAPAYGHAQITGSRPRTLCTS
jgi:agmatinase